MKYLVWLLKAAIFFTLFAFALNNQHTATVHFFFGRQWSAPLVLVVLAAFTLGLAVGALGMVPRWWRQRSAARRQQSGGVSPSTGVVEGAGTPSPAAGPGTAASGISSSAPHGI
jgi:putative membrane protein